MAERTYGMPLERRMGRRGRTKLRRAPVELGQLPPPKVNLVSLGNATIGNGTGTGTILNDDAVPTLSIGNVSLSEGNTGTTDFVFTVTQSEVSGQNTTVAFSTGNGTATEGSDFTPTSGTLTIAAGA